MTTLRVVLDLPCRAAAVAPARAVARGAVTAWGRPQLSEVVALVVSELVSNAAVHAPDSEVVQLELADQGNGVRVALADGSTISPVVRDLSGLPGSVDGEPRATHGRGMAIVHALAERWGVDTLWDGKRVWVEILDPARSRRHAGSSAG